VRWSPAASVSRSAGGRSRRSAAIPIRCLRQIWPLADGLVSLLIAYAVTAALSYFVARATWHLVERHAQDLAHRLTSARADRSTIRPTLAATAAGLR